MNDYRADRLDPVLSLTGDERRHIRTLSGRDSVSLLSAAYAAALGAVDNADALIERMLSEVKPCDS